MNDQQLHSIILDLIERIEELERSLAAVVARQKSLSIEATRLVAELGAASIGNLPVTVSDA